LKKIKKIVREFFIFLSPPFSYENIIISFMKTEQINQKWDEIKQEQKCAWIVGFFLGATIFGIFGFILGSL